jgi:hypothetical protein
MTPGSFVVTTLLAIPVFARGASVNAGPGYRTYQWPVRGPVIRGFEPPSNPYGPGHRGIDIAAPFGSPMVAAQDGIVAFAGWIGGSLFISIDHADGVRTTYSWLSAAQVKRGDAVSRGSHIGATGQGHPGMPPPHLHFGARVGADYIDPMLLLEAGDVVGLIHLAPLPDWFLEGSPRWPLRRMESASSIGWPAPQLSVGRSWPVRVHVPPSIRGWERAPPVTAANTMAGPCRSSGPPDRAAVLDCVGGLLRPA